ncbi:TadE/TadG family type IV pilus assembly protein [Microvirga arabica]|uniref:TadE/TadG family type IV pilus assembly protein n=1 Tax=Microvirga arabica TaxID=1128671 RepID=A0ABV6Y2W4_9HYPH
MTRTSGPFLRLSNCQSGSTAVEFALIAMAMLVLSLGTIEFGRGLYLYNRISFAMDRAARLGITYPNATDQQLADEVLAEFPISGIDSSPDTLGDLRPSIEITLIDTPNGLDYRVLSARMLFKPLVPNLLDNRFTLSVSRRIPKII